MVWRSPIADGRIEWNVLFGLALTEGQLEPSTVDGMVVASCPITRSPGLHVSDV